MSKNTIQSKTEDFILLEGFYKDELIALRLAAEEDQALAPEFYRRLFEAGSRRNLKGPLWSGYLWDKLLCDANLFSRQAAWGELSRPVRGAAQRELALLQSLAAYKLPEGAGRAYSKIGQDFTPPGESCFYGGHYKIALAQGQQLLLESSPEELSRFLEGFYQKWGYGNLCAYSCFNWEQGLKGVRHPDAISLEDLIGYEWQKAAVYENTAAFLAGKGYQNLLLYGERGTGKSSLIKAVANHFAPMGLRIVYLARQNIGELEQLLSCISAYKQKFIIFLDDLSFEAEEKDYKELKTIIEGGLSALPEHAVLYTTTNRRHIIAESWQDRQAGDADMYISDTVAEKLALAERFGITIVFRLPSQEEYLSIVSGIAKREGIEMDEKELSKQALLWERWQNSRSGRTARQFVASLSGSRTIQEAKKHGGS